MSAECRSRSAAAPLARLPAARGLRLPRGALIRETRRRRSGEHSLRAHRPVRPALQSAGPRRGGGAHRRDLRQGHVSVVNVFGSWCEPCHYEHPNLMALAADPALKAKGGGDLRRGAEGLFRERPPLPRRQRRPLFRVGLDTNGRAGIDWGVYGVPETFIVKGDGSLTFKLVGRSRRRRWKARSSRRS